MFFPISGFRGNRWQGGHEADCIALAEVKRTLPSPSTEAAISQEVALGDLHLLSFTLTVTCTLPTQSVEVPYPLPPHQLNTTPGDAQEPQVNVTSTIVPSPESGLVAQPQPTLGRTAAFPLPIIFATAGIPNPPDAQKIDEGTSVSGAEQRSLQNDVPGLPPIPVDLGTGTAAQNRNVKQAVEGPIQDTSSRIIPFPDPSQVVNTDHQNIDNSPSEAIIKQQSPGRKFYEGMKTTLRTIERVSDVFTPLKSTAAALLAICETIDAYGDNLEEFERLLKRVEILYSIMESWPEDASHDAKDRTLVDMEKLLKSKVDGTRSGLERAGAVLTGQDKEDVLKLTREIELAMEIALFEATVTNERRGLQIVRGIEWLKDRSNIVEEVVDSVRNIEGAIRFIWEKELLRKLGNADGGEYTNPERGSECTPGTRLWLLSMLMAWAEDPRSPHLFWLNGLAGTGKSAVAKTLCSKLNERGLLGATHFCTVKESELRNVYLIIPTLAKILAQEHPKFGVALQQILADDGACRNPTKMQLKDQYVKLILGPAEQAFCPDEVVVLCVDALDECEDKDAIEEFLAAILSQTPTTSIKFFLTSRPERALRQPFKKFDSTQHKSLRLHEIDANDVRADITLFLDNSFKRNNEIYEKYQHSWPPPEIEKIADHSGNLFIVASTAFKYIASSNGLCVRRFQQFAQRSSNLKSTGVNVLYEGILAEAFKDLEDDEVTLVHSGLSLLITAQKPLSVHDYGALLGTTVEDVRGAFNGLHSVVQIPEDGRNDATISIFHASFFDYLTSDQPQPPRWTVVLSDAHSATAKACFRIMDLLLCFGVSGAQTSYKSNNDQPMPLSISTELAYACTSWGEHVIYAGVEDWQSKLQDFLGGPMVLYWLEALSVARNVQYAYTTLWRLAKMLGPTELGSLLSDVGDFVHNFHTPISHSAPHLYLSALPCYAAIKKLDQASFPEFKGVPKVHHRPLGGQQVLTVNTGNGILSVAFSPDSKYFASGGWDGDIRVFNAQTGQVVVGPFKGHTNNLNSVAFSPDGRKIASGLEDKTVRVWDAQTAQLALEPLTGHTDKVNSVGFSPDGRYVVSGSDDKTVRVWDLQTGQPAFDLSAIQTGAVKSVGFSPNGMYIVFGSSDNTVQVWDTQTCQPAMNPFTGHTGGVCSVAFSPDGRKVVSGSEDCTIWVWDAQTGLPVSAPFTGHTGYVLSVAFSPDGSHIVSGSGDQTVQVWDAQMGQPAWDPFTGHSDWVRSVAFSPDGKHVISGSGDGTIQVWDWQTNQAGSDRGRGHTGAVKSVAFSPDGRYIVSGSSDKTIGVWDVQTGQPALDPYTGHSGSVQSVAFSPDGRHVVSGSDDKTIQVWDVQTGQAMLAPFRGHEGQVTSVAFSKDGRQIISGSADKTVRVWDARTGKHALDPFTGHTESVRSVAFSPNGQHIVSASDSDDKTIWVWDVETGQPTLAPFQGHSGWVTSVVFSPDGRLIASGSILTNDKTIQLWDTQTGQVAVGPFRGHTGWVLSVAFSPDGRWIVSGSKDKTIRIWDVQTGKAALDPFVGHTDIVWSVAFSPDGSCVASGSDDRTIRVWKLPQALGACESPENIFLHDYPPGCVTLGNDGWLRNTNGDLLMWIPPSFRDGLYICGVQQIIGRLATTKIELRDALCHGEQWLRCQESPPGDPPVERVHWPISTPKVLI
ncbi:hypothetical protein D9611_010552 [Ephemerocybe angulata]|uniref:Nephrocystin 3-like N-terminal domain-containing protein n=1 Tax=Ephemerocybe angulata TaxID=980116 RepID=A0A8H5FAZ6_9AGAR|nr:hypothetical protein D9611_010552 [Tulosesus angulatus]